MGRRGWTTLAVLLVGVVAGVGVATGGLPRTDPMPPARATIPVAARARGPPGVHAVRRPHQLGRGVADDRGRRLRRLRGRVAQGARRRGVGAAAPGGQRPPARSDPDGRQRRRRSHRRSGAVGHARRRRQLERRAGCPGRAGRRGAGRDRRHARLGPGASSRVTARPLAGTARRGPLASGRAAGPARPRRRTGGGRRRADAVGGRRPRSRGRRDARRRPHLGDDRGALCTRRRRGRGGGKVGTTAAYPTCLSRRGLEAAVFEDGAWQTWPLAAALGPAELLSPQSVASSLATAPGGIGYVVVRGGLLVSRDRGRTWDPVD